MSTDLTECPNCQTKLKGGVFGSVSLLSDNQTRIINVYQPRPVAGYCTKCSAGILKASAQRVEGERSQLSKQALKLIGSVPVVSIHSPLNWDYTALGMVTGQSTTGTGVISEFTSSFADLFGAQSGAFNRKIKTGEALCAGQIRKAALELGGNAVIGTDIDYAEVGGEKGMLMVCMAGTAVRLKNLEVLDETYGKSLVELEGIYPRLKELNSLNLSEA